MRFISSIDAMLIVVCCWVQFKWTLSNQFYKGKNFNNSWQISSLHCWNLEVIWRHKFGQMQSLQKQDAFLLQWPSEANCMKIRDQRHWLQFLKAKSIAVQIKCAICWIPNKTIHFAPEICIWYNNTWDIANRCHVRSFSCPNLSVRKYQLEKAF